MKAARKVATNLTVRSDLVRMARDHDINLSDVLENALEAVLRARRRDDWLRENRDAIDAYNKIVARRGVFSDGRRRF